MAKPYTIRQARVDGAQIHVVCEGGVDICDFPDSRSARRYCDRLNHRVGADD